MLEIVAKIAVIRYNTIGMERIVSNSGQIYFEYKYSQNLEDEFFPKHFHNYYEILFFIEGHAKFNLDGMIINLVPFSIVLVKPQAYHFIELGKAYKYKRFVISFDASDSDLDKKDINECFNKKYLKFDQDSYIYILLNLMKDYAKQEKPENTLLLKCILNELLILIKNNNDFVNQVCSANKIISSALWFIDNNLFKPFSLDDIAKELYISKYYLSHKFKECLGINLMTYVRNKKLLHAQQLIKKGTTPTSAAKQSGFPEYSQFFRAYKKFFDKIPSQDK